MDLRQMRTFLAAADEKSFSAAAAKLYLSQQMVSKTISAMEEELGGPLFIRTTKKIEITELGKRAYGHFRFLVDTADQSFRELREIAQASSTLIRIICYQGIQKWCRQMIDNEFAPLVGLSNLSLTISYDMYMSDILHRGDTDLLFTIADKAIHEAALGEGDEIFPVKETFLHLVVAGNHRWSGKEAVSAEDLRSEPLVRIAPGPITLAGATHASYHSMSRNTIDCPNLASMLTAIEMGKGYGLLPDAEEPLKDYDVKCLSFPFSDKPLYITAVARKGRRSDNLESVCRLLAEKASRFSSH